MIADRIELRFVVPGRPPSPNATRRRHWSSDAGDVAELRRSARFAAIDARNRSGFADSFPLRRAHVELVFVLDAMRGDLDNLIAGSKPILDGIVDARVLTGDDVATVLSIRASARRGRTASVEVAVTEAVG